MSNSKLTFSKEIAETIGLREAILLDQLKKEGNQNRLVSFKEICSDLSFLPAQEVEALLSKLVKIGLISSENKEGILHYSSGKKTDTKTVDRWIPDQEILDQINEYGIPEDFANLQLEDFNQLSNERNDKEANWGIKFLRFVIKKWRFKEAEDNKKKKLKPIHKDWSPNGDAKEILLKAGITEEFIQKELPEFIMYWSERNEESDIWNSKFIAHIRRRWGRFSEIKENDDTPSKMSQNWTPNEDFYDILQLTDIPREFAESTKPEFIMYWKESGQSLTSWNSKFLQHVKFNWEKSNRGQNKQLSNQLENRIESSWKIDQKNLNNPKASRDTQKIRENFKKLKDKHRI